ncbi:hypothetical protein [Paenibacillus sp. OSY-SE]|uniref:hypothetical protein n=1 Tax=Paenibacillus sp. OSY-SE TaxID=1196323 RepID=UPI00031ECFB6|nr:hypothetical protein [Paenibacillus sp. OSY-SE]
MKTVSWNYIDAETTRENWMMKAENTFVLVVEGEDDEHLHLTRDETVDLIHQLQEHLEQLEGK